MSLVSQNAVTRDGVNTKKRKKEDEKLKETELIEMKKLESALFGNLYTPVEYGKVDDDEADRVVVDVDDDDDSALFYVDRAATTEPSDCEEDDEDSKEDGIVEEFKQKKAVWVDEEEQEIKINIAKVNRLRKLRGEEDETVISGAEYVTRLKAQHVKLNPNTDWARPDFKSSGDYSSDDEENDILRSNEDLVVKNGAKLLPGILEYSRLVDANSEDISSGPINSVHFHRNAQLLLTAGLDKKLRFFQVDGKRNTKIQSIFLEDCPIRKAAFVPDGSQVIVSGRRRFFYSFDIVNAKFDKIGPLIGREERSLEVFEISPDSKTIAFIGNEGYILLVSSKTKELIGTLKMNGTVRSLAFSEDGKQLLSSGGDGHVYTWDLRTRTCIHKGTDEGCITGTALSVSPTGGLFAAASDTGIVNIYKREEFLGGKRKPIKTLENLSTRVDFMKFNKDAQILAICSTMKKNAMRLMHVPSLTVFSNWPPPNSALYYPRCLDFSPGGGFMAVGNAAGKVLLYKLHHYQHA